LRLAGRKRRELVLLAMQKIVSEDFISGDTATREYPENQWK